VDIEHTAGARIRAADTLLRVIIILSFFTGFPQPCFAAEIVTGVPHSDHLQSLRMIQAAVITVSDRCSRGEREDLSGPAVVRELEFQGFDVRAPIIVADEREAIEDALREAAKRARLVVTTGGTGIARRDVTPEATRAVCDRLLDGVAEVMRAAGREETPLAALGRGVCGTLGESGERTALLLNLPGNPAGAVTSLRAVAPLLGHALDMLAGKARHGGDEG